jgi:exonuclease SbcC
MWTIDSIKVTNFFSYKELEYKLINNQLTMIFGINADISKKKSNGSGKSTILDSISFALTGDTLKKLKTIKKIINNGEEQCSVTIDLSNKILKSTLSITRTLGQKQGQKVLITYNGEEQSQLVDLHPRESDAFIEEKLGISFDDLTNYFLISKFRYKSLFLANDADKKDVINRFSRANLIDDVFPHIEKEIEEVEEELLNLNNELLKNKTSIELYEKQIEEVIQNNSDEKKEEKIKAIELQIEEKNRSKYDIDQNIRKCRSEILTLNTSILFKHKTLIKELELKKHDDTIKKQNVALESKRSEYKNIRNDHSEDFKQLDEKQSENKELSTQCDRNTKEFEKSIKELESYIAGDIECPKCKHHFILADKDFNIEEAKEDIKLLQLEKDKEEEAKKLVEEFLSQIKINREKVEKIIIEKQNKIQVEADKIKTELNDLEGKKLELTRSNNKILSEISDLERQVKSKEQSIKLNDDKILNEQKYIEQYKNDIIEAQKDKTKEQIKDLNDKIEELVEGQVEINKSIEVSTELQAKLSEWEKKFKRFKSFLCNQALATIQSQANYYLEKMNSELTIQIDGFRELKNGKLKEEIDISVSRDGINNEEFAAYSGGERSLVDICAILSMQDIINKTSVSGGINFLGVDEVLESLDSEGVNNVVKCLNLLDQTVLLIVHSSPNESIECNKVMIEKKNNISKILS